MFDEIKQKIKEAKYLLITAGAGMGVDSGLPDFRGNSGFWRAYPALKNKIDFASMANPKWFKTNPKMAWAFYGHRLNLYRNTKPHKGFKMLLDLPHDKFVFTSNVDGQFQKAGFDEEKIVEIHGSINYLQCTYLCNYNIWENKENIEVDMDKFEAKNLIYCPYCNKVARPNILMFDDWDFIDSRVADQINRFKVWLDNIDDKLVIIEIGAGIAIPTVRNLSEDVRDSHNATLIRINPDYPEGADFGIKKGALEALKEIL